MQQEFMNEILADKKDRSDDIFWNYFNEGFIDLRNAIIKEKKFLQMKIQIKH